MSRRVLLPPMPPNPTVAMFTVSLGAWNPRPSTCRGRMVTPAPAAVAVRNVRLEMSLMDVLAGQGFYRRPREAVNLPDPFTVYESINARACWLLLRAAALEPPRHDAHSLRYQICVARPS